MPPRTNNATDKKPIESTSQGESQFNLRNFDARRFKGPENQLRYKKLEFIGLIFEKTFDFKPNGELRQVPAIIDSRK